MRKLVLVSNKLYHYRYELYLVFREKFEKQGIEFLVYTTDKNGLNVDSSFISTEISVKKYLNGIKPDIIINFLHLSDRELWLTYFWSKSHNVPNIYWNHGINLQDPNNGFKNKVYHFIHRLSDAIILYSKNELKYINKVHDNKTFIANNTINFGKFPLIPESKAQLRVKHNIPYSKCILFVGRMQKRKQIEVMIDIVKNDKRYENIGFLIVGPGFDEHYKKMIKDVPNIVYLGAIYDHVKINEIYKLSDVFCIPGTNGLGVNQALYWGLPCFALNVNHSPEAIYIINEKSGFIVQNQLDLADKIYETVNDVDKLNQMSIYSNKHILKKASVDKMFEGFENAINYCCND